MRRYRDPLFVQPKKRHRGFGIFLVLLLLIIAFTFFFNYLNNCRVILTKQTITINNLPNSLDTYKILQISDLDGRYFGPDQNRILEAIGTNKVNLICITGDVIGKNGSYDAFLTLIDGLVNIAPVYFITGDEDPEAFLAVPHNTDDARTEWILAAEQHGATWLDAPVAINVGSARLWLSPEWVYTLDTENTEQVLLSRQLELQGEAPSETRSAALQAIDYQLERLERIHQARLTMNAKDIQIALTHHPLQLSAVENLQEWSDDENASYARTVSLILAGHYAGGQWVLPVLGPLKAPESAGLPNNGWYPGTANVSGLSYILGIPQYIDPGLGVCRTNGLPAFRLFNTPSISLLTLSSRVVFSN